LYPKEGDHVETTRGWPSTRHDIGASLDVIFPRYIDTLHGFVRPVLLNSVYQGVIRSFAGFGELPRAGGSAFPPMTRIDRDVLVVGSGKGGTLAIEELKRTVGEERLFILGDEGGSSARSHSSLVYLPPVTDRGFRALAVRADESAVDLHVNAVMLVTRGYDASLLFPGNDLPGVMTGEGAEALLQPDGSAPFAKGLLFGGDERAAEILAVFKNRIAAISAPAGLSPALAAMAEKLGVPRYPSHRVLEVRGGNTVREAVLLERPTRTIRRLNVDSVILAHRRLPESGALFQVGARMTWRRGGAAYYPEIASDCATSVPGLFAAGEVAGFVSLPDIEESARRAAAAIAEYLRTGKATPIPPIEAQSGGLLGRRVALGGEEPLLSYYRELLEERSGRKTIICPCEDVCLEDLKDATMQGWGGMEVANRMTGLGMGLCQGRYCLPEATMIMSVLEGRLPEELGFITKRPPTSPVPLGSLAGGGP
jgi:hypothetical protein